MVAAAKMRRAQEAVVAARPYARKLDDLIKKMSDISDPSSHPLLRAREVKSVAVVIVTADRGLCGAFNSNLIRAAVHHINANYAQMHKEGRVKLVCVGRKGNDFFSKNDYNVVSRHTGIFATLNFSHASSIVSELTRGYLQGEYDRVDLIYNEFKSIVQQRLIIRQILPINEITRMAGEGAGNPHAEPKTRGRGGYYIFEPSAEEIIFSLLPKHLNFQMWHTLLESNAAEQGARMAAMDNATTNASDLIKALQLSYNKARQASITKELLEIVSGAEALKAG